MMRLRDYLTQPREVAYQWRAWRCGMWAIRCHVGIHAMKFDTEVGRSWSEPGEPGWECRFCGNEGFPVRIRFSIWLEEHTPVGPARERWFFWRHPVVYGDDGSETCGRHGKKWFTCDPAAADPEGGAA